MKPGVVLIVDDNVELAENVAEILSEIDGRPTETLLAKSAEEARAIAQRRGDALDVMILDRRLPDADGLELASELRRHAPLAEAVIITGDVKVESALAAVGRGVFAYVLKPFAPPDLVRATSDALARVALLREREQLRQRLEQSERHHREVVEAVPAFVVAIGASGEILLWNRQLEAATGYTREEMLGHQAVAIVGDGGDQKLPVKGGGHRIARWRLADVPGPGPERITYAAGIDVTAERGMQLRTLRAERLAAVGTLAAGLAHEVRNPLNSANLQLQVLRRRLERGRSTPEALLPVIDVVHDEIRRLEQLVTDFLAFARPQSLDLKPVALAELLQGLTEQLRPEAEAAKVVLEVSIDARTGTIEADAERLRQVLINLLRNAVEATEERGGQMTLRALPEDEEGFVTIQIEDTGPGIPDDAPIFDAFYTTKATGTGLGLAIVHRIVQEHGGTIQFESRPGRTCFSLRLPSHTT
jgi:signal transduction histidine kinase